MKFRSFFRFGLLTGVALAATVAITDTPVHAQEAKLIGRFGDWEAYTRGGKSDRFCYIVSKPKEASLRSRRGDIFLLIWHRPAKQEFDVVQVDAGYAFKKETEVGQWLEQGDPALSMIRAKPLKVEIHVPQFV